MAITTEQLLVKIQELKEAAESMTEPDKTFALSDIDGLQIQLESMALSDIAAKLNAISLPEIKEMDEEIAKAKNAMAEHQKRVDAFNFAFQLITKVLKIALFHFEQNRDTMVPLV